MRNSVVVILVSAIIVALLAGGCTQSSPAPASATPTPVPTIVAPADTVKVMDSSLGKILTDAKGLTLYYFITDVPASGTSTCYTAANCTHFWPIFSVDSFVVSPPLRAADFSSMARTDGTKQTAYSGWPLYYFVKDAKPGDVLGENVLKTWYVAKPDYTVMIASKPETGAYLTDPVGKTLYFFNQDTTGTSTCTGACIAKWPAFSSPAVVAPSVLKPADFSQISRADGIKQTAFMGKPLYYYSGDAAPGAANGQGLNGRWYVANITGALPAPTPTPTTVPTTVPTTIHYSSGGGGY